MLETILARATHNQTKLADYLHRRGISMETAARYELGYMSGFPRLDEATDEGKRFNRIVSHQERKLVVPVRGASGRLTALITRSLTDKDYCFFDTAWGAIEGPLLGMQQAVAGIDASRTLWLVEGVFDTLAVAQAMHAISGTWDTVNVLGLMTVYLSEAKLAQMKRYADRVYLCLDNDEAGRAMADRQTRLLKKHFHTVETIPCPVKDWAQWHEHNPRSMQETLAALTAF